jgi:hypothetical protein
MYVKPAKHEDTSIHEARRLWGICQRRNEETASGVKTSHHIVQKSALMHSPVTGFSVIPANCFGSQLKGTRTLNDSKPRTLASSKNGMPKGCLVEGTD